MFDWCMPHQTITTPWNLRSCELAVKPGAILNIGWWCLALHGRYIDGYEFILNDEQICSHVCWLVYHMFDMALANMPIDHRWAKKKEFANSLTINDCDEGCVIGKQFKWELVFARWKLSWEFLCWCMFWLWSINGDSLLEWWSAVNHL